MIKQGLGLFFLAVLVPSVGLSANESNTNQIRFVVTGGLSLNQESAFFESELFKSPGFIVVDAPDRKVWRFKEGWLYSDEALSAQTITDCASRPIEREGHVQALLGSGFIGLQHVGQLFEPVSFFNKKIKRKLGGTLRNAHWQIKTCKDKPLMMVSLSSVVPAWPKAPETLRLLPAALTSGVSEPSQQWTFFGREVGSAAEVLGVVDRLLRQKAHIPTGYIDLGGSSLREMKQVLLARKPVAMGVSSRYDFGAYGRDPNIFEGAPYMLPAEGEGLPASTRLVEIGSRKVSFAELGGESPDLLSDWAPMSVKILSPEEAINKAAYQPHGDLMLALAQGPDAASKASSSPIFDAVLSLVSPVGGSLPTVDEMNLSGNLENGLHSVAPIIGVSPLDVTEVVFEFDDQERVVQIRVERHSAIDTKEVAQDFAARTEQKSQVYDFEAPGLVARKDLGLGHEHYYSREELDAILGSILMTARKADLAIIEQIPDPSEISGAISKALAIELLKRESRAIVVNLRGRQLKRIFKLIRDNKFGLAVSVTGADLKKSMVAQRVINEAEPYELVVTERVFNAIVKFLEQEGLLASNIIPSSTGVAAITEGDTKESLKILTEAKKREFTANLNEIRKHEHLHPSPDVIDILREELANGLGADEIRSMLDNNKGKLDTSLFIIEISDFDFGFKSATENNVAQNWRVSKLGLSDPRLNEPTRLQVLLYSKVAFRWVTPSLDIELSNTNKYFHPIETDPKARPTKDSLKFEGELRVPLERMLDRPGGYNGLSPVVRFTYETQLWPNVLMTPAPPSQWATLFPPRVNDGRVFTGLALKPLGAEEIFRVGPVFAYHFNKSTFVQAFDFGPEIGVTRKWTFGPMLFKFETTARYLYPIVPNPDKDKLGLDWAIDGKVEFPLWAGFSVSGLVNWTLGNLMVKPTDIGSTLIVAMALSYGNYFKWAL